jgi:hypothetical protein
MEIIKIVAVAVAFAVAVWVLYTLVKISDKAKEKRNDETNAPYKVEPPKSTEQLAISIAHKSAKRKYTKRSKYWNSAKVKAKMSKARKARKPSKSK